MCCLILFQTHTKKLLLDAIAESYPTMKLLLGHENYIPILLKESLNTRREPFDPSFNHVNYDGHCSNFLANLTTISMPMSSQVLNKRNMWSQNLFYKVDMVTTKLQLIYERGLNNAIVPTNFNACNENNR